MPTSADDGFLMTAGQLRASLTERSRLLILCTPSNPSGAVYPRCVAFMQCRVAAILALLSMLPAVADFACWTSCRISERPKSCPRRACMCDVRC